MSRQLHSTRKADRRAEAAILAVLPRSTEPGIETRGQESTIDIGGRRIGIKWAGEGNLRDVRQLLAKRQSTATIAVARKFSPGARDALSDAGVGWVDETGAAEIAFGSLVISRSGRPPPVPPKVPRWTPSALAVAEALLCSTKATVEATTEATGLSTGSCINALRMLTDRRLLETSSPRGRGSGRRVSDMDRLLDAYAEGASTQRAVMSLQVGVNWRDPVEGLIGAGSKWTKTDVDWAATGIAAASVIAGYITNVTSIEVYIDADTIVGLEAVASDAGLRPIEGGRLTLRPYPTVAVRRLAEEVQGLRVAPWPRVYVDLRSSGVRGEDAAEHLREAVLDR